MSSIAQGKQNIELDLFKLYDPLLDDNPKKWIFVEGNELRNCLYDIVEDLKKENFSISKVSKIIGEKLNCHEQVLRSKFKRNKRIPILILLEFIKFWKEKCRKSKIEFLEKKGEILSKIELIKARGKSKPVKAVKNLSEDLCRIAGAHAADGCIFKDKTGYAIAITDGYENNLREFSIWLYNVFGLRILPKKLENKWIVEFKNKVIARYLIEFLGFPVGKKSHIIHEPHIIKNSQFKFREAFVQGFLSFEAGIGIRENVELCTRSLRIVEDVQDVVKDHGLKVKISNSNGFYSFRTKKLSCEEIERWIKLFAPYTEKWFKIQDMKNGFSKKVCSTEEGIGIIKNVYPQNANTTITDIFKMIKASKKATIYDLAENVNKSYYEYIRYCLLLLEKMCIVKKRKQELSLNDSKAYIKLNENFRKKLIGTLIKEVGSQRRLGEILKVDRRTIGKWFHGKRKIQIDKLKRLCELSNISFSKIEQEIDFVGSNKTPRVEFIYNPNVKEWMLPQRE